VSLEQRKDTGDDAVLSPSPAATDEAARLAQKKAAFEINKLSKRLHRQVGQAVMDFNMIEAGDKVMVCLSGGKVIGI
jgi:tRNA 2-thiocytidine biosynthesis protein TtcA